MKILIVEDDYLQADSLRIALRSRFREAKVDRIRTEHEFIRRMSELKKDPPDIALIDIMVRWTDPADDMPEPPPEVDQEGYYRAGIRCMKRLREIKETSAMPIILYTVLQDRDMEELNIEHSEKTRHFTKDSDPDELFEAIGEMLEGRLQSAEG